MDSYYIALTSIIAMLVLFAAGTPKLKQYLLKKAACRKNSHLG